MVKTISNNKQLPIAMPRWQNSGIYHRDRHVRLARNQPKPNLMTSRKTRRRILANKMRFPNKTWENHIIIQPDITEPKTISISSIRQNQQSHLIFEFHMRRGRFGLVWEVNAMPPISDFKQTTKRFLAWVLLVLLPSADKNDKYWLEKLSGSF